MKKKLAIAFLTVMMVVSAQGAVVLAGTEAEAQGADSLRNQNTEADQVVSEKIDDAVRVIQKEQPQLPVGSEYGIYEYDLGDNCTLQVELQDRAEDKEPPMVVRPMAASGSANVWKDYGNRYFTAKATIEYAGVKITLILENHYTLSANGIDERYGKATCEGKNERIIVTKDTPIISKATAKSVNSTVAVYCNFTCHTSIAPTEKYKMNTTVKYLSHDKAGKRLQVQQAWNLTKVS